MTHAADIIAQAKQRRAECAAEIEQLDRMIAAAEGKPLEPIRLVPLPAPCPWPHYPPSIAPYQPPTIVPMLPHHPPFEPFGPMEPFPFPYRTTCCNVVPQVTARTGKATLNVFPTGALS